MKILMTGGKSAIALKLLKAFVNEEVILADYGDIPIFKSANYKLISLGEKNEETLAHTLLSKCLDHDIDAILPLYQFEFEPLAKAGILFNEFNVNVMLPEVDSYTNYLLNPMLITKTDWVIYATGKVIFSTKQEVQLIEKGEINNLNGAFYFDVKGEELKLSLIRI